MSALWLPDKILKLHWLKCSNTAPKRQNLNQKINDSKSHIWIFSFNFRYSRRTSQSQQKLVKNITHFTIKRRSKNLTRFTKLEHS